MLELMERTKELRQKENPTSVHRQNVSSQPSFEQIDLTHDHSLSPSKCISCIRKALTNQIDLHDKRDQVQKEKSTKNQQQAAPLSTVNMVDFNLESWRQNK